MEPYDKLQHPLALLVFLATLFLPVGIGFLAMRRTRNQSDFLIGGRAMGKIVVALSAVSSGRSSWLVLGVSGIAYMRGTGAIWSILGYTLVEMVQFVTIGRRLRNETGAYNSLTLLDYFETRFRDRRHRIRVTGAVIILIFITSYVAWQLNAGARSLSTALNFPLILALAISGGLILIYMVLGGYIAVAYNDVVRSVIMLAGLVVFPVYGLARIGGLHALMDALTRLHPARIDPFSLGMGAIIGALGIGLGSPGQPHIVVRYMSIEDSRKLRFSAALGTFWNLMMGTGSVFIGLIGRVVFPAVRALPGKDEEMIYLVLTDTFFSPAVYGLLLGGIFAAILSTADSQLMVVASTFVRDVYEKLIHSGESLREEKKLRMSRYVVIFSGILAMVLAYLAEESIYWLILFSWGGLGASLGPPLIFSLYWKKANGYGIVAGMVTGMAVTFIWRLFLKEVTGLYELIPAFFCSCFAVVLVSLITKGDQGNVLSAERDPSGEV